MMFALDSDWGNEGGAAAPYPRLKSRKLSVRRAKEMQRLVNGSLALGEKQQRQPTSKSSPIAPDKRIESDKGRERKKRKQIDKSGTVECERGLKVTASPKSASDEGGQVDKKRRRRSTGEAPSETGAESYKADPPRKCSTPRKVGSARRPELATEASTLRDAPTAEMGGISSRSQDLEVQRQAEPPRQLDEKEEEGSPATSGRLGRSPRDAAAHPPKRKGSLGPQLLEQMSARLEGSKFRWLNETLYTTTGGEALALMQEQPGLFDQYHQGFRHQTRGWPEQPVDAAIAWLKRQPTELRVADFGCGDAALALAVPQRVKCLDLVATRPGVIACDMSCTPLETASMDVVVFCLALMGTDYPSFLKEATRVLKPSGVLWIAEVRSRFVVDGRESFGPFLAALKGLEYRVEAEDATNKFFVIFRMRKAEGDAVAAVGGWPALRPCLYKRR